MIVADSPVTPQDLLHQLFTVNSEFQCEPDIVIIIRWYVGQHRDGVVRCSGEVYGLNAGYFFQQMKGFPLTPVHCVNLTRLQCIDSGTDIIDVNRFNFIEVAAPFLPIVRIPFG